ncbi:MAG: hypothetical protein M3072_09660 [Candidatus Dormibacteraeota bacterium]|nr:hypothetical protein [Candidatus Dormibacteraeota bacterium]
MKAVLTSSAGQRLDSERLPLGPVSYQFVNSRSPAHLVYPNAQTLRVIDQGESRYPAEGITNSAFAGAILLTQDSPAEVYSWYQAHLQADRWKPFQLAALLSTQLSAQGYQRGAREAFVVAMNDPKQLSGVIGKQLPSGGTLFEYSYSVTASR